MGGKGRGKGKGEGEGGLISTSLWFENTIARWLKMDKN